MERAKEQHLANTQIKKQNIDPFSEKPQDANYTSRIKQN